MAGILEGVDQHTRLAGENRLELLLFRLNGDQLFAINVFKVQEVMHCPLLTAVPGAHPVVRGLTTIRGKTLAVIDLNKAIGGESIDPVNSFLIVVEYNRSTQGFLVNSVDHIVNMNWKEILPPPQGAGNRTYLTAVTHVYDHLVGILDVERVFSEVVGVDTEVSPKLSAQKAAAEKRLVLVVDDSLVARNQVKRTFDQMDVECIMATNGQEALDMLKDWAENESAKLDDLALIISDIEMPVMDGYTLTTEIRQDPRLKGLFVLLHSSLSGVFNKAMVKKVGADYFVAKFDSNELAKTLLRKINSSEPLEETVPA
jgi:two-component system chemotaxis response regulator CheV